MSRTILVHLNVEAPDSDERDANTIADAVMAALEVGMEGPGITFDDTPEPFDGLKVVCPLAEEVQ